MRLAQVCLCVLAIALTESVASAEQPKPTPPDSSAQASITGTVTDQTGAVLPAATITVTSAAGIIQTATTNDKGEYSVSGLAAGTFSLKISVANFARGIPH